MHRHGNYKRYKKPKGAEKFPMQRYLCLRCGHTVSVLAALPSDATLAFSIFTI